MSIIGTTMNWGEDQPVALPPEDPKKPCLRDRPNRHGRLVVVESFTGVWWLTQAGITNVVALMGASCSEKQAGLLRDLVPEDGSIWLLPDGDTAGERMAEVLKPPSASILSKVSCVAGKTKYRFCSGTGTSSFHVLSYLSLP